MRYRELADHQGISGNSPSSNVSSTATQPRMADNVGPRATRHPHRQQRRQDYFDEKGNVVTEEERVDNQDISQLLDEAFGEISQGSDDDTTAPTIADAQRVSQS